MPPGVGCEASPDGAQSELLEGIHQEVNQPPAQEVAFAAACFPAIKNEIMIGNRPQAFLLALSWVY